MPNEIAVPTASVTGQFILMLIAIMLASGSLGGLVNYYLARLENPTQSSLKESLVIGTAASLLVPLFLQMISSDLLQRGTSNHLDLFVFAGFCLIAAVSSKAFVRTLSDQVLKEARAAKAEAKEARMEVNDVKSAAANADTQAVFAVVTAESPPEATQVPTEDPLDTLLSLAKEYNRIRDKQESGLDRTKAMTKVVRQMINLAPLLEHFPVEDYLREQSDRGKRLAAYAYLYSKPKVELLTELVHSVTRIEDRPFGQYWGIQAIGKVIGVIGKSNVQRNILIELRRFRDSVGRGTDRYHVLSRILE